MKIKKVMIDGQEVAFAASAAIPRQYRNTFGRDIFTDINALSQKISANSENASTMDIQSLEVFENIAYIMAKHADKNVPDTPEEWLDGFGTFSVYQVLPQIVTLWTENLMTTATAKKNNG